MGSTNCCIKPKMSFGRTSSAHAGCVGSLRLGAVRVWQLHPAIHVAKIIIVYSRIRYTVIHGRKVVYACKYTQIHGDTRCAAVSFPNGDLQKVLTTPRKASISKGDWTRLLHFRHPRFRWASFLWVGSSRSSMGV